MKAAVTPADIEHRAAAASDLLPRRCAAPGCKNVTQRSARNGLSETLCKRHVEFRRRHGSHWRRSYTMAELGPFQAAARRWLRAHQAEPKLERVTAALGDLIAGSGTPRKAQEARWLSTEGKVRNALHGSVRPGSEASSSSSSRSPSRRLSEPSGLGATWSFNTCRSPRWRTA